MGACINDAVFVIIMRQILIIFTVVKSKLEYFHSRKVKALPQFCDGRGDNAEILRNNRKRAEFFFYCVKKPASGAFHPFPARCVGVSERYGIIAFKTAEMIYSQYIKKGKLVFNPFDPPVIPRFGMVFPYIKRIAPKLARTAEIIGRDSGNINRKTAFIKLEKVLIRPDVGAVISGENGYVAYNFDIF